MKIDGKMFLFFSNFSGIRAGEQLTPATQMDVRVVVSSSNGTTMHVLPFLGAETTVKGTRTGERVSFDLPALQRGTVIWFR
jgi:hypothetical protein